MRGLIMRAACTATLAFAMSGCLQGTPSQTQGTRDQSVAMSSIANFDSAKFSGRWYEVEAYVPEGASCVLGAVTFSQQSSGDMILTEGPCADGDLRRGVAKRVGPGRFEFADDALWVLWVDQTYDVAVIATPTGKAHVLSRSLDIPSDKRKAARDILTWNGFDVTRLRPARRR
ncbi:MULTISPECIES: lipocalin family protein [Pacificibacter]|uniref:lipocalin family protein n=1 Tax=Pacificibacter TaxID=1042323 RepID=UPI001C09DDDD|nr:MULTISPECIES: lipocalin family protein [Pacificibacter]MBU2935860.1 lipocalin family protein [Pacificibacter marinus]MDO6614355.1 lipocalin family protein [Pacificibacter sp. 1_MG-2023]